MRRSLRTRMVLTVAVLAMTRGAENSFLRMLFSPGYGWRHAHAREPADALDGYDFFGVGSAVCTMRAPEIFSQVPLGR